MITRILLCLLLATPAFAEITREDLRKTLEHMQQLTRMQQGELDELRAQNAKVEQAGKESGEQLRAAQIELLALNRRVQELATWGNQQADQARYWQVKHQEAAKKLWWWRLWGGGCLIVGVFVLVFGLVLRFTKWGAGVTATLAAKYAKYAI